jgi:hypothetical protein
MVLVHLTKIASAVCAVLLLGLGGYFLYKRRSVNLSDVNFETRISNFESRVNDLQDILLSIDDRLDRRLKGKNV